MRRQLGLDARRVSHRGDRCFIAAGDGSVVLTGTQLSNGLWVLDAAAERRRPLELALVGVEARPAGGVAELLELTHRRLGHPSRRALADARRRAAAARL